MTAREEWETTLDVGAHYSMTVESEGAHVKFAGTLAGVRIEQPGGGVWLRFDEGVEVWLYDLANGCTFKAEEVKT